MKKVTQFVWNNFKNDARLHRECSALSEVGYDVHMVALKDPKFPDLPSLEIRNKDQQSEYNVHRINFYPWLLEAYRQDKTTFLIVVGGVTSVISVALFYRSIMLLSTFLMLLIASVASFKKRFIRKWFINLDRSIRMAFTGYKMNADIYQSNDLNTLIQGVICSKFRLKPRPLIYDSHEVQTDRTGYNKNIVKVMESNLLRFVDVMMVENHTRAAHNEELYGFYPYTLYNYSEYYNIEDKEAIDIHAEVRIDEDEKILLYQGGLQAGRGLHNLINAMPYVDEGILVFIGDGKLKDELKQQVVDMGLQQKVKFIGRVDYKDLARYTKNAYVGFQVLQNICFNHYSASSNKLFEYLMADVPVIASDLPEIRKVFNQYNVGELVNPDDPQSIAKAINKIVQDETMHASYVEGAKQAKHVYNWNNEKEKLYDVYRHAEDVHVKSFISALQ